MHSLHSVPLLDHSMNSLCVIIDVLYYIHMPPTFGVDTYEDYFSSIWSSTVAIYTNNHRCQYVHIIIDKPEFLPAPRTLVHQARLRKAQSISESDPKISDASPIPHGNKYWDQSFTSQALCITCTINKQIMVRTDIRISSLHVGIEM